MSAGRWWLWALLIPGVALAGPQRVQLGPDTYRPLFPPAPGEEVQTVAAFRLDVTPVTNAQYLAFVKEHPRWQRDQTPGVFARPGYLSHWEGPTTLGPQVEPRAPVVRISWFAARAYCQARGGRLPTEAEWELAAAASATEKDARSDPAFTRQILEWYGQPSSLPVGKVGQGRPNLYGVEDLHGLVWEWVLDFGNTNLGQDSRGGGPNAASFCGAGASATGDKRDYAAFMRVAYRSSLKANFTLGNQGFRCAADVAPQERP